MLGQGNAEFQIGWTEGFNERVDIEGRHEEVRELSMVIAGEKNSRQREE